MATPAGSLQRAAGAWAIASGKQLGRVDALSHFPCRRDGFEKWDACRASAPSLVPFPAERRRVPQSFRRGSAPRPSRVPDCSFQPLRFGGDGSSASRRCRRRNLPHGHGVVVRDHSPAMQGDNGGMIGFPWRPVNQTSICASGRKRGKIAFDAGSSAATTAC
jgi:hypothetical protein